MRTVWILVSIILLIAVFAWPQASNSTVRGQVTDQAHAVINQAVAAQTRASSLSS